MDDGGGRRSTNRRARARGGRTCRATVERPRTTTSARSSPGDGAAPTPGSLIGSLERLIVGAVAMTTRALSEGPGVELTLPQWRVLVVVAAGDGLRVGEVASRVGVGMPSASRLVRRVEDRGLVTTERDELDRRATRVRVTTEGRRVVEGLVRRRRRMIAEALAEGGEPLPEGAAAVLEVVGRAFARFS